MSNSSHCIHFGTDGWRGIIGREFTEENVRILGIALGRFLQEFSGFPKSVRNTVVVGYDCRFASERFARVMAQALSRQGLEVLLSSRHCPTPAVSFTVLNKNCKAGVMITASHNPPIYNGVKIRWFHGGPISEDIVSELQKYLGASVAESARAGSIESTQLSEDYLARLKSFCDTEIFHKLRLVIGVDYMHGSLSGYLEALLIGSGIHCIPLRNYREPLFGGTSPEPLEANILPLKQAVMEHKADLGVAFDGDGDRLALIDSEGKYLSVQELLPILLEHLVRNRGWKSGVGKTYPTSQWVNIVAESLGVPVLESLVGFKHLSQLLLEKKVILAGEESGGIGVAQHIPERDALLAFLLFLEKLYYEGVSFPQMRRNFRKKYGELMYQRKDIRLPLALMEEFESHSEKFVQQWVEQLGMQTVQMEDGWKGIIDERTWVMIRKSGTEPVVRIYAEAPTSERLQNLVETTKNLFLPRAEKGG